MFKVLVNNTILTQKKEIFLVLKGLFPHWLEADQDDMEAKNKQGGVLKPLFLLRIVLQSLIPWPGNLPSMFLVKPLKYALLL